MTEVTTFDGKFVLKFVGVFALIGLTFSFFESFDSNWPWILNAVIWVFSYGILGILVFGATTPLVAWYKHFRNVKQYSRLEALSAVIGGLVIGAGASAIWYWLTQTLHILAAFAAAATIWAIVTLPYFWVIERRHRARLNTISTNEVLK